jgi:hypothetical protein
MMMCDMGHRNLNREVLRLLLLATFGSIVFACPAAGLRATGCVTSPAAARSLQQDDSDKPARPATASEVPGELRNLAGNFDKIARLKITDRVLQLDLQSNEADGHQGIYEQIQGTGLQIRSSSWGGNQFHFEGSTEALRFRFAKSPLDRAGFDGRPARESEMELAIEQVKPERRSIQLVAGPNSHLQILFQDASSHQLFRFRQGADGQVSLLYLSPDESAFVKADTFEVLLREHPVLVNDRFIPAIGVFGLGNIVTPWSASFRATIRTAILPWNDADRQRAESLIAGLDAEAFDERQAASTRLAENAKQERELLLRIVESVHFKPETRARVYSAVRQHLSETEQESVALVCRFLDQADENYLREIMQAETDVAVRELFERHLASNGTRTTAAGPATESGSESPGDSGDVQEISLDSVECREPFKGHSQEISQLLQLAWKGDQLALDRNHWKVPFGGREVADLVADAEKYIEMLNLPPEWFKPGGNYGIENTGHPQILFDRMARNLVRSAEQSPSRPGGPVYHDSSMHHSTSSQANRYFNSPGIKASLVFGGQLDRGSGQQVHSDSMALAFSIRDRVSENGELLVEDDNKGFLRVLLIADSSDCVACLVVNKDTASVQVIYQGEALSLTGKNFRELLEKNREFLESQFFPLLARFGVSMDEAVFQDPETTGDSSR